MKFTKMQGTGNDFVVIEPDSEPRDWAKLAVAVCDRHFGIGADGILLLLPSKSADFRMRIFNSDGSEAEMCGNGLRCLVKYFVAKTPAASRRKEIKAETAAGMRKAWLVPNPDGSTSVKLSMGKPRFADDEIPVTLEGCEARIVRKPMTICTLHVERRDLPLALISMGNPHAVYFTDKPVANFPLCRLGPKIEHHQIFPEGTNFEVVRVRDRQHIDARVWERGAAETLACGTGACAITVAARINGYVDDKVSVNLPGGTLHIEWSGEGEVFLTGPAEFVFSGVFNEKTLSI
jgi:diaminopimelate epimerase